MCITARPQQIGFALELGFGAEFDVHRAHTGMFVPKI